MFKFHLAYLGAAVVCKVVEVLSYLRFAEISSSKLYRSQLKWQSVMFVIIRRGHLVFSSFLYLFRLVECGSAHMHNNIKQRAFLMCSISACYV